jgi:hypothetical protein
MESKTAVEQSPPPQAVIMQMVMGAWVTKVISEVTRLEVPDLVKQHGSMHAAEMVTAGGIQAAPLVDSEHDWEYADPTYNDLFPAG